MLLQITAQKIFTLLAFFGILCTLITIAEQLTILYYYRQAKTCFTLQLQEQELEIKTRDGKLQQLLITTSVSSQEAERRQVALDLHDDLGPMLCLANLFIDELHEHFSGADKRPSQIFLEVRKLQAAVIEKITRMSFELTPLSINFLGLCKTLHALLHKTAKAAGVKTYFCFHHPDTVFDTHKNIVVFRIVQEALKNIEQHSEASFIHLTQYIIADKYVLELRHDGRGLDQKAFEQFRRDSKGLGLKTISSHLLLIGGQIIFDQDDNVCNTFITIPLEKVQVAA